MKKKVLLSSIATIALCLCLIAGSTFALFTDSTNFNIAVTAGDVEIYAKADIKAIWSASGENVDESLVDAFLVDENNHSYNHVDRTADGTFINGGVAELTGENQQNLTISRLTPGDRVDVDIVVENKSDVAMVYRYKLISNNTNLATGMVVTIDVGEETEQSYEALAQWTSEWYPVIAAPNGEPDPIPVKTISVELPVYAGNEYQSEADNVQSVEYTIIVEAVQGNAVTDDESAVVVYQTEPVDAANLVQATYEDETGVFDDPTLTDVVVVKDLYLTGKGAVSVDRTYNTVFLQNVTADLGDAPVVTSDFAQTYVISDCNFKIPVDENGAVTNSIIDAPDNLGGTIILINVYVNDTLVTEENDTELFAGWADGSIWVN
ncbi:MAG: hypothetical protein IJX80_09375 [Clostridia bacterium]|nr:hypothetical protein [Clostridia bacterium]